MVKRLPSNIDLILVQKKKGLQRGKKYVLVFQTSFGYQLKVSLEVAWC